MKKSSVRCKRCNKILTSPEARQRGYGELCWKISPPKKSEMWY